MEDNDQTDTTSESQAEPEPDPRLVAVEEAADALKVACNNLPDTPSRGYALMHIDAVPIYAAQAIREETERG